MTSERLWRAVAGRDEAADGLFVYAVRSTGIYCRPSCASRKPGRNRVEFFPAPAMAEASGYRPCRRCHPDAAARPDATADAVRRACDAIAARPDARWTGTALARAGGTSLSSLQRSFRRALGLSPRDYVAACRRRRFLHALRNGHRVTDAIYEAGYGSPSRVYGAMTMPGMTPATYGRGGAGASIAWATTPTRIGRVLVAATDKGLCFVCIGATDAEVAAALRAEFPKAVIADRPSRSLDRYLDAARRIVAGERWSAALPLDIRGTAFQWRVWRALTSIPPGETRSYRDVAASIGKPTAVRAVARACATNPVALVVPCHRVVAVDGTAGGYRWGTDRKERLLKRLT
jgi:AraC family transcriptional regulator of adaptative response/methylated-DNA-[protein]-cysteine methyltransferase